MVPLLRSEPARDDPRQLFTAVFLQEVAATFDRRVRLPGATRYVALERGVAAARDRVAVGKRGQERLLERAQRLPGFEVRGGCGIVEGRRDEHRELARARLVRVVGERRAVR